MKKLFAIILCFSSLQLIAGETGISPSESSSNKNSNACAGVDPEMPEEKYTPGMQYIKLHDFENTRDALWAARKDNIRLTQEDLCFLVLAKELEEQQNPQTASTFKPECEGASETHACNGGGVQPGEAGEGKNYLKTFDKNTTSIMTVLNTIVESYDPVTNPIIKKVGYGDLQYQFHDMTPASVYEQQIANTSAAISALMTCHEEDIAKCTLNESEPLKLLKQYKKSSPKEAIEKAINENERIGMGALIQFYTLAPGKSTTLYQESAASGLGDPMLEPGLDPNAATGSIPKEETTTAVGTGTTNNAGGGSAPISSCTGENCQ